MTDKKAAPAAEPLPSDWVSGQVTYTLKDGKTVTFRSEITVGEMANLMFSGGDEERTARTYGMREVALHLLEWTVTMRMPDGSVIDVPVPPYEPGATESVREKQFKARLLVLSELPAGRFGQIYKKLSAMKVAIAKEYEDEVGSEENPTGTAGETGSTSGTESASE